MPSLTVYLKLAASQAPDQVLGHQSLSSRSLAGRTGNSALCGPHWAFQSSVVNLSSQMNPGSGRSAILELGNGRARKQESELGILAPEPARAVASRVGQDAVRGQSGGSDPLARARREQVSQVPLWQRWASCAIRGAVSQLVGGAEGWEHLHLFSEPCPATQVSGGIALAPLARQGTDSCVTPCLDPQLGIQ